MLASRIIQRAIRLGSWRLARGFRLPSLSRPLSSRQGPTDDADTTTTTTNAAAAATNEVDDDDTYYDDDDTYTSYDTDADDPYYILGNTPDVKALAEEEVKRKQPRRAYPLQRGYSALPDFSVKPTKRPKRRTRGKECFGIFIELEPHENPWNDFYHVTEPKLHGPAVRHNCLELETLLHQMEVEWAPEVVEDRRTNKRRRLGGKKRGNRPGIVLLSKRWHKQRIEECSQALIDQGKNPGDHIQLNSRKVRADINLKRVRRKPWSSPLTPAEKRELFAIRGHRFATGLERGRHKKPDPLDSAAEFISFLKKDATDHGKVPRFTSRKQFNQHELDVIDVVYQSTGKHKSDTEWTRRAPSPPENLIGTSGIVLGDDLPKWIHQAAGILKLRDPRWPRTAETITNYFRAEGEVAAPELFDTIMILKCSRPDLWKDAFYTLGEMQQLGYRINMRVARAMLRAAAQFERKDGVKVRLPSVLRAALPSGIHPVEVLSFACELACKVELEKALIIQRGKTPDGFQYSTRLPRKRVVYGPAMQLSQGTSPTRRKFAMAYPSAATRLEKKVSPWFAVDEEDGRFPFLALDASPKDQSEDEATHLYAFDVAYDHTPGSEVLSQPLPPLTKVQQEFDHKVTSIMELEIVRRRIFVAPDGAMHEESERALRDHGFSLTDLHRLRTRIAEHGQLFNAWISMASLSNQE